jgi:hypothetical protein
MLFALICTDKPDSLTIRMENRPDHLAYLQNLGETLVFAGPFLTEDGEAMNGSLIVIEPPRSRPRGRSPRATRSPRRDCSKASRSAPGCGP